MLQPRGLPDRVALAVAGFDVNGFHQINRLGVPFKIFNQIILHQRRIIADGMLLVDPVRQPSIVQIRQVPQMVVRVYESELLFGLHDHSSADVVDGRP